MMFRHFTTIAIFAFSTLAACEPRTGEPGEPGRDPAGLNEREARPTEPDNTARNAQDRETNAKTPFDQNENGADIATTAAIRREILKTEGLSTNADNVKIITADGMVTLRGVVASEAERETVRSIAQRIAGSADKVDVQLDIDPDGDKADKVDAEDDREDEVEGARDPVQNPSGR
jgi:hyperosmotically inducible periplasmic protein